MEWFKIEEALRRVEPGLIKYERIMEKLYTTDVSMDAGFQKMFNGFYRIRQRKPEFYMEYYSFLETNKTKNITFDFVINHFYSIFQRVEASFSSKMVATINPNYPVWDEYVLNNLGLKRPSYGMTDRINKTIKLYNQIVQWYRDFLKTDHAKKMISMFDAKFKSRDITDTKKIDLILWQTRG